MLKKEKPQRQMKALNIKFKFQIINVTKKGNK